MKSSLGAVLVLAIAGIVFFSTTNRRPPAPVVAPIVEVGPSRLTSLGGWIADFVPQSGSHWGRHVTVLGGSQKLADFRMEFPAQIDYKALGWVFRAQDSKNFYAMKLEMTNPLPQSPGTLTRFAVIDGQEQPRVQIPLSMELRPNTVYTIRMDALGSSFTTWIQGQKVDQWSDPQIREGGVGLYTEMGERSTLKGDIAVFAFPAKR